MIANLGSSYKFDYSGASGLDDSITKFQYYERNRPISHI